MKSEIDNAIALLHKAGFNIVPPAEYVFLTRTYKRNDLTSEISVHYGVTTSKIPVTGKQILSYARNTSLIKREYLLLELDKVNWIPCEEE